MNQYRLKLPKFGYMDSKDLRKTAWENYRHILNDLRKSKGSQAVHRKRREEVKRDAN